MDQGGLKTRLSWDMSSGASDYRIYAKNQGEPYLQLLGTTSGLSFDTDDEWVYVASITTRSYVVSAVDVQGTESFLPHMVKNDDRDHDGLTDVKETMAGSNPDNPDSDGEGLLDGEEYVRGTNPLLSDTDGDGYNDYKEIQAGSDPLDENSVPTCPGDFDHDGDVDGSDLAVFAADFGRTNCATSPPCEGDFDLDGDVDGSDLAVFAADFGRTGCPTSD